MLTGNVLLWGGERAGKLHLLAGGVGVWLGEPRESSGSPAVPAGAVAVERRGMGLCGA